MGTSELLAMPAPPSFSSPVKTRNAPSARVRAHAGEVSLVTDDLGIRFGGHQAVAEVSAKFRSGILTAIVGPNGAGKTTFFNLVSGQLRATSGRVALFGEDITALSAPERTKKGLGRAFQLTNLFPALSVLENVRLAVQATQAGAHRSPAKFFTSLWSSHKALIDKAMEIVESTRLARHADKRASELSHGDQRKLEVAILTALNPTVFMFDEPTAGMTAEEAPVVLDLIRNLKRDRTKTLILVEHKMDVVRELADRVIVMHEGRVVADGEPSEVIALPVVQEAYLGKAKASA